MFEQASIDSPGLLKRPLAMTISLAGQAAAVSAVALVSLIHIESLPKATLFGVTAPPRPVHSGVFTKARPAPPSTKQPLLVFTAPAAIPVGIHTTGPETTMLAPVDIASGPGVPGGVDFSSGAGSRLLDSIARLPPPAPAPARAPEKAAPISHPTQVHVSIGVQAAKLIRQVTPVYPPLARQARIAGTVRLTAIISREGAIRNLQVMSGHPLLTAAALDAVKQWLYQPTLLNEEPVEVITQIDVNFTLSR